jgi:hypothetical protein
MSSSSSTSMHIRQARNQYKVGSIAATFVLVCADISLRNVGWISRGNIISQNTELFTNICSIPRVSIWTSSTPMFTFPAVHMDQQYTYVHVSGGPYGPAVHLCSRFRRSIWTSSTPMFTFPAVFRKFNTNCVNFLAYIHVTILHWKCAPISRLSLTELNTCIMGLHMGGGGSLEWTGYALSKHNTSNVKYIIKVVLALN